MKLISQVDFEDFHLNELPRRLAKGNGELAAATMKPGRSFAWKLTDGQSFTYQITEDSMEIMPGHSEAELVVELSPEEWNFYVNLQKSCFAMLYTKSAQILSGKFDYFVRWEPALLAAYIGMPLYDEPPELLDLNGEPLDLYQTFSPGYDPKEAKHFLHTAGFLHFKNIFEPTELEIFEQEIKPVFENANPDDERSWWAEKSDGSSVCCRLTYLSEKSSIIRGLQDDERLLNIGELAGKDLSPCPERLDGYSLVIKHGQIQAGLSDLPWHKDCGIGGHSLICPGLNAGIQLNSANAESGQLHYLAGSHQYTHKAQEMRSEWPTVAIEAEAGDVTAHFGHTLHAAPPPQTDGMGRRTLYVNFNHPKLKEYIPEGKGYNDVLFSHKAGQIRSPQEVEAERAAV